MIKNLFYDGQDFYVEGHYTAPIRSRNSREYPDEPEEFEIDLVIHLDCRPDGQEMNTDVTELYCDNQEFINECLVQRQDMKPYFERRPR